MTFAAISVMESAILIGGGPNLDLSEQFVLSCATGGAATCSGGDLNKLLNFLKNPGTVVESGTCFNYKQKNTVIIYSCGKGKDECPGWEKRIWHITNFDKVKISGKERPTDGDIKNLKQAIYDRGPITLGFYETTPVKGIGVEAKEGKHIVTAIGWDSNNRCWICKDNRPPSINKPFFCQSWDAKIAADSCWWIKY